MNQSRRNFLRRSFSGAALVTLGGASLLDELFAQKQLQQIKGAGVDEGVVQLIWNENPLGPSPKAVEAVTRGLFAGNRYQSPEEIEDAIARHHGIDAKYVTKGEGATEILFNVPLAFLEKGDNIIMAYPTYTTSARIAELIGAQVKQIPLTQNYEHDLDAFTAAIDNKTRVIVICNPNNPTGTITPTGKIKQFLAAIPENIVVMIDEAYFDFAENPHYETFDKYAVNSANVIVVRTFSKVYGLAGLRIGYAIANEKLTKIIRGFNLRGLSNLVACCAAPAALSDQEFVARTKAVTRSGKEYFYKEFAALGYKVPKSETNHIFVDLGIETKPIIEKLKEKNILIRPGSDWKKATCIRISMGTNVENEAFMTELKRLLRS